MKSPKSPLSISLSTGGNQKIIEKRLICETEKNCRPICPKNRFFLFFILRRLESVFQDENKFFLRNFFRNLKIFFSKYFSLFYENQNTTKNLVIDFRTLLIRNDAVFILTILNAQYVPLILYKIRGTGPLFCNVPLILYDFRVLKLQNKGPPTVN